jgi:hypothetical protein
MEKEETSKGCEEKEGWTIMWLAGELGCAKTFEEVL